MIASLPPAGESERLDAVRALDVLDTAPDEQFDALVRAASIVCETPISLVTLVDAERQWFKANFGLPGVSETPRDIAFCAHAILGDALFEVPDATQDARFSDNPLVEGDPDIRFYAGVPLMSQGHRVGTLCVIDRRPKSLSDAQREVLRCLAVAASRALDDRRRLKLQQLKDGMAGPLAVADDSLQFIRSAWFVNAIANAASDLIAYWDRGLRCRFANRAYGDWFGVSPTDIVGQHIKDVIGERLFALNERRLADVLRGEEQVFENAFHRADGTVRHVLVKYIPHIDSDAIVCGFYVSVVDVTSLKHTASRLEATEARFRTLSESSPHGVFHSGADGSCLYTNQRWQEIFGLGQPDSLGRGWERVVHPEDRPAVLEQWRAAELRPAEFDIEFRVIHSDARVRRVRVRARPVDDPGRGRVGFVGSAEDVTEREAILAKLTDSESRFRLLADASSDMIQRLDLEGTRQYVSPAARAIFGRDPEDLIGTHPADFIHADDALRVRGLIADVAAGRPAQARSIHRIRHEDGHWVWVEVQFSLVRDRTTGAPSEIVSALRDITDREALQRNLGLANHNLLIAEEIAHVGHWRVDLVDNAVTWSAEVYRIYGLDPSAFRPTMETAIDAYHPDDRADVRRHVAEAVERRQGFDFQLRILRPCGDIRHVVSRGLCEVDVSTGALTALFGVIMDITDLAKAERSVREKSALLETTLDNMDQALVKIAADGTIELANRRFAELLDLPAALLEGPRPRFEDVQAFLTAAGDERRPDAPGPNDAAARSTPLTLGTYERSRPDGTILEVRTVSVPDGAVVRTYADITARRQAEAARRASEARYRLLAESTSDVILQLGLDLTRQYVSPACLRVLGYRPEEMLSVPETGAMHPDEAEAGRTLVTRLAAGAIEGDRAVTTYRALHKDGHYVWLEAGMNLVRDEESGAPVCVTCTLRDVTERQRTARHLDRARAAAEQAAAAKAEFLANMSHELRTPLTGMLGIHDLLRTNSALDPAQHRLITLASDAGRSLLAIVNDILDFSKIDAGQLAIESLSFAVRPLLESCRVLVSEGLAGKALEVALETDPGLPDRLVGDPTRVRQVLLNLLTNAVKFTERGRITVRARYDGKAGQLRVEVSDTGIGIAPDKVPMLFGRFSQTDASTTRRYGGSGLGLAISKRLTELMSGRIGVESRLGTGSTFWFVLPLRADESGASEERAAPEQTKQRRRVLLAEDNDLNREIIATMLTHSGYDMTTVANGAAAVEAAQVAGGFDLILMDLQMPVMDGLTATAEIRRLEIGGAVPVAIVGLTANAMAEDVERCLASGMDAHVAKPIHWPDLFATMDRLCDGLDARRKRPRAPDSPADVLDDMALEELCRVIGKERVAATLRLFEKDLGRRMEALNVETSAALAEQAHSLAGLSGMLGFKALSRLCLLVEAEARRNHGFERLAELREAMRRAGEAARTSRFVDAA